MVRNARTTSTSTVAAPAQRSGREYMELWLEVRINGSTIDEPARVVRHESGALHASAASLERWRVRAPTHAPVEIHGRAHYSLDAIDGLHYEIDARTQTLVIDAAPELFLPTVIRGRGIVAASPDRSATGGFLNYDLQYHRDDTARRLDGIFEFGLFNRWGSGTANFLASGLDGRGRVLRLDTAWTRDDPQRMRSLRIGDSISRGGGWVRSVRFAGLQWGSDYATRPEFVQFPLPSISGEAALPSTVELYIDNALRLTRAVPYGPFTIPDVPVISGEGEVRLVVRDALGREQVSVLPYYASPGLLKRGVHDYTYEAGFERRRFALESNDYGRFFLAGTHRFGVTDRLALELRSELLATQQTVGVGAAWLWPGVGVVNAAFAGSHAQSGNGGLLELGIERHARPFSFGIQSQLASRAFTQLGYPRRRAPARHRTIARAAYSFGRAGSVFATHVRQANRSEPAVEFITAGYNRGLPGGFYLSVFAMQSLRGASARSIGVNLVRPLGARTSISGGVSRRAGETGSAFQLQRSLPAGRGVGYRVSASDHDMGRAEMALLMQSDKGTYSVEAARFGQVTGYRLSARGGIAALGGAVHLSRRLDDSFALVKVGDYSGVQVLLENQPVARTNARGTALVPALRAYQNNSISIGGDALPLDAEIGALRLSSTPARRSGTLVSFPVRSVRGALLHIVLEDGGPLPAGATIKLRDDQETFPVALRGESYVTGLTGDDVAIASWKGQHCIFRIAVGRDAGPLPALGPFVCRGVRR